MFFRMVYKSGQIFLPFCHNTCLWQTDGQMDRQTDGQNSHHKKLAWHKPSFKAQKQSAKFEQ